jgi:hypothetical protein
MPAIYSPAATWARSSLHFTLSEDMMCLAENPPGLQHMLGIPVTEPADICQRL